MNRWVRLVAAVVAMIMIANLQYAWTLFVRPLMNANGWKLSEVQWGFTFFIALETWMQPVSGWLIDRIGPRLFMSAAAVLCGIGWGGLGQARTPTQLYILYGLAGLGAAWVYCGSTAMGLKWFPDKRGLAAGLIAAGFGSGAAFFIPIIAYIIRVKDFRAAFLYTGIVQGLLIFCAAQFLQNPHSSVLLSTKTSSKTRVRKQAEQFNSFEMLRTPHFYVLYLMELMMGIGGLMATAQVGPVAHSFGYGAIILTVALTLTPIGNGGGRLFWGWISDHLGRERTMIVAFLIQAASLVSVIALGRRSATWFIISLVLVFFTWGEIYALFPSATADFFGAANVSSNYSFLYSSKGVASVLGGGLAALMFERTGSWNTAFYGSAVLAFGSALLAWALMAMPLPKKRPQPVDSTVSKSV